MKRVALALALLGLGRASAQDAERSWTVEWLGAPAVGVRAQREASLLVCDETARCEATEARLLPGDALLGASMNRVRGEYAFLIHDRAGRSTVRVLDLNAGMEVHSRECSLGSAPTAEADIEWGADGVVIVSWSAGSFLDEVAVCDAAGQRRRFSAPQIEISPDARYVAGFAPRGAPVGEVIPICIYSVQTAAVVRCSSAAEVVSRIYWGDDQLTYLASGGRRGALSFAE
jgi:hypothetical protein